MTTNGSHESVPRPERWPEPAPPEAVAGTVYRYYEEPSSSVARLADGQTVDLPYTHYKVRMAFGSGATYEATQSRAPQHDVPAEAWEAIAKLKEVLVAQGSATFDPAVLYENYYAQLQQTEVNGEPWVTTADSGRHISAMDTVTDGWVAALYDDSELGATPIRSLARAYTGLFGPGNAAANAFWLAGDPRMVVDPDCYDDYVRYAGGERALRDRVRWWVIAPVRYYKVALAPLRFDAVQDPAPWQADELSAA